MDQQILNRPKQVNAGLKLVRWLQAHYGIKTGDVVGHATANDSRYFMDKTGIKNGAGDWFAPELKAFSSRSRPRRGTPRTRRPFTSHPLVCGVH